MQDISLQKREGAAEPRHSWTAEEDAIIMSSVAECGRRWNRIAERLPRRTEHAIRNRWHRLQMAVLDKEETKEGNLQPNGTAAKEMHQRPSNKRASESKARTIDNMLSFAEL